MSTISYITDAYVEDNRALTDTEALELYWTTPQALLDLIYGPTRRIAGVAPAHDHDEDGGESLLRPILSYTFYSFPTGAGYDFPGVPLGPGALTTAGDTSFAAVTANGITDRTAAHKLFGEARIIPGGVLGLSARIIEYHTLAGVSVGLTLTVRLLSSVNYKLGVPTECYAEFDYVTSGAAAFSTQKAICADLSALGDPALDREVEIALWLSSDILDASRMRLCHLEVVPHTLTSAPRRPHPRDLAYPALAAREVKGGLGLLSGQFAAKIKETYNGLNRALWGSTPGLLNDQTPDRRRRYRETVLNWGHRHQGLYVPDGSGGVFADGACLTDAQAWSYNYPIINYLSEPNPEGLNPEYYPQGVQINTLAGVQSVISFRRSIPAGLGELRFRVAVHFDPKNSTNYNLTNSLKISIVITPVGGGGDIVTRLFSGPYASPTTANDTDYGYTEVRPLDDPGYRTNASLDAQQQRGWSLGAEVTQAEQDALHLVPALYRISEPIMAQLTYPVLRPSDAYRATQDYDITIRGKLRGSSGTYDHLAYFYWVLCSSAPGY